MHPLLILLPKWKKFIVWKKKKWKWQLLLQNDSHWSTKWKHTEVSEVDKLAGVFIGWWWTVWQRFPHRNVNVHMCFQSWRTCRTLTWNFKNADGCSHPYLMCQVSPTTPWTNSIRASALMPQSIFKCRCHSCQMEDISCWHEPAFCLKQTGSEALSQESDRKIKLCFGLSLESLQSGYTVKLCRFL